jgi:hypothetical protein
MMVRNCDGILFPAKIWSMSISAFEIAFPADIISSFALNHSTWWPSSTSFLVDSTTKNSGEEGNWKSSISFSTFLLTVEKSVTLYKNLKYDTTLSIYKYKVVRDFSKATPHNRLIKGSV